MDPNWIYDDFSKHDNKLAHVKLKKKYDENKKCSVAFNKHTDRTAMVRKFRVPRELNKDLENEKILFKIGLGLKNALAKKKKVVK